MVERADGYEAEVFREFDLESFSAGLESRFERWRACWSSPNIGPFLIVGAVRPYLGEEQLRAEAPEEAAYADIIDYASRGILEARGLGLHQAAIDAFKRLMSGALPGSFYEYNAPHILIDVLKKVMELS